MIDSIPKCLFERLDESTKDLAIRICLIGGLGAVWPFMVKWFLDDPVKASNVITDAFGATLEPEAIKAASYNECQLPPEEAKVIVHYKRAGNSQRSLVINKEDANHSNLVCIGTPLGKILTQVEIGCSEHYIGGEVAIISRTPLFPGLFHLAADIRSSLNQGADCFSQVELPSEPENQIATLQAIIKASKSPDPDVLASPKIPFHLKLNLLPGPYLPDKIIQGLSSSKVTLSALPNFGKANESELVMDTPTIIYFCLFQLVTPLLLESQVYITEEVKQELKSWIARLKSDNYLGTFAQGEAGEISIVDRDLIQNTLEPVIKELRNLLNSAVVLKPKSKDLKINLIKLANCVDISSASTLKAADAHDLPYCTIEPVLASAYVSVEGKSINTYALVSNTIKHLSSNDIESLFIAYCHLNVAIPITLTTISLYSKHLTEEKLSNITNVVERFETTNMHSYDETLELIGSLMSILIESYTTTYTHHSILLSALRKVLFACMRAFINSDHDNSSEMKITHLLCFVGSKQLTHERINFVSKVFMLFVEGHFMDSTYISSLVEQVLRKNN